MRKLSEGEVLTLTAMLRMETEALELAKSTQMVIEDEDLKKAAETGIMASEARIRGIQQFINENHVLGTGEVK